MRGVRHKPTTESRATARTLASFGIPQDQIALVLKIDAKTLRAHYVEELSTGSIVATAKVAANLYRIATGSGRQACTAAIFWMKCRAGWSEFAPPPKPAPLGKKEQAEIDAVTAAQGTTWAEVLGSKMRN